ncbi:hypothetical protein MGYG_00601 [Nannizzia gypsea CBS 118893]|uniref:Uncharacterized protein n=1 Tax=Arthroderma gypseum (strain ATCC MYA-4604 / CBS 118893) TaxID=535722 RepID=E5R0Q4_ARTGP|nr:hypothetical protein MGYG_00601 [Nannizzia gypsea CBS 118893]EFQ97560.1 hypothetical protein MGYG_00601 [Nannizzia gypsea CBS 118893]
MFGRFDAFSCLAFSSELLPTDVYDGEQWSRLLMWVENGQGEVVQVPSQDEHPCDTAGAGEEDEEDDILAAGDRGQSRSSRSRCKQGAYAPRYLILDRSVGSNRSTEEVPFWQPSVSKGPEEDEGEEEEEEERKRDKVEGSRREMRLKKRREGYVRASKKDASHGRPMETSTSWMACHGISRRGGHERVDKRSTGRQPARQAAGVSRQAFRALEQDERREAGLDAKGGRGVESSYPAVCLNPSSSRRLPSSTTLISSLFSPIQEPKLLALALTGTWPVPLALSPPNVAQSM